MSVVLPDFEHDAVLTINGAASGPSQDFLRFIAQSPVGDSINHFTDPFRVEGAGNLDPASGSAAAPPTNRRCGRIRQFARNRLQVDPALPAFAEAGGSASPRASSP